MGRNITSLHGPEDPYVRAGAPATAARQAMSSLIPSYDANSNDVWSKRMNSLRRFVGLVSSSAAVRRTFSPCSS